MQRRCRTRPPTRTDGDWAVVRDMNIQGALGVRADMCTVCILDMYIHIYIYYITYRWYNLDIIFTCRCESRYLF